SSSRSRSSSSSTELRRMCPQQKARYLAYQQPTEQVKAWAAASRKRCAQLRKADASWSEAQLRPLEDPEERRRRSLISGQLKAAEANSRLCSRRRSYQAARSEEIRMMIACQSSAQAAIRLELLLPAAERRTHSVDWLDRTQRQRVEEIMEDDKGLTLIRS
uniref:protein LKAAEAR1-like n=1 Tax=Centroberyx gerrardi TaxID=166262 RepID=UPI003AAA2F29